MTIKQTIKAWKNAEHSTANSPVGTTEVNSSILSQVQGGRNNVVYTGCIPDIGPKIPSGPFNPPVSDCPSGGDILVAY
jgi:hypothetical protein